MSMYGSNEELIQLLNTHNSEEYVNDKFLEWLNFYPDILNVTLDNTYNHFFDDAIRNNMGEVLRHILRTHNVHQIYNLTVQYHKEIFENIDVILDEDENYRDHFCKLVHLEGFEECALKKQEKILSRALEFTDYKYPTDSTSNLIFLLSALPFF